MTTAVWYTGIETTMQPLYVRQLNGTFSQRVLITGSDGNLGGACVDVATMNLFEVSKVGNSREVDLSNPKRVEEHFSGSSPYDLIIMAHGYQYPMQLKDIIDDPDTWNRIIVDNLSSCAFLTSFVLKHRKINPNGLIVYISSIQATHPREGRGAYAAAKAGVEALMRTAAQEMYDIPARAIALRLGQFTTPMKGINFSKIQLDTIQNRMPLGLIDPKQVAVLIFDLYKNPNITGEVIHIDSGHSLQIWK